MSSTKIPKAGFKRSDGIEERIRSPRIIPRRAEIATKPSSVQGTASPEEFMLEKKPHKEFNIITKREARVAEITESPPRNIKAGTIKNPPPAPTKPSTAPISKPAKMANPISIASRYRERKTPRHITAGFSWKVVLRG